MRHQYEDHRSSVRENAGPRDRRRGLWRYCQHHPDGSVARSPRRRRAAGGVAWERIVVDPQPGPRHFDEIEHLERLNETVARIDETTHTHDGIEFAETAVARHYDEDVLLLDIGGGARGVAAGLDDACDQLDIDLIVGTDAGGDVLAAGDEPGIKSPLTDALMLSALTQLEVDACLGMYGYGSDGELTLAEVTNGIERAIDHDGLLGAWGLTPQIVDELTDLLEVVTTEASRLPVEVARGKRGEATIRDGARSVDLTPASTVTFYLDPAAVAATSALEEYVTDTESFEAAHNALSHAGYETELDLEQRLAAGEAE